MTRSEYEAIKMTSNTGVEWRPIAMEEAKDLYLISANRTIYSIVRHRVKAIRKFKTCKSEYVELNIGSGKKFYQIDELMLKTFPEMYPDNCDDDWKNIVINGEASTYEVSRKGNVRRANNRRILKPVVNSSGYFLIRLRHNNKTITKYLHRLVAEAFIPNPNGYDMINHKDENRLNDKAENLEWCDRSYNFLYSYNRRKAELR